MNKKFTNVEKTNFTKKTIIEQVKKHYNIDVTKIERIIGGSANLYKIYSDKGIYVLKEFQKWYNKDIILTEVNVINHLRSKNISVPEYVKCLNNDYSFNYKGCEVILQKFIEGIVKKQNTGDKEDLIASARLLGQLVNALEDYPYTLTQNQDILNAITFNEEFKETIAKNNELINKTKDESIIQDLKLKNEIAGSLSKQAIDEDINKLTFKNSHGDFGIVQLIYGKEITVIDLATAMNIPIVYEVIRSYSCVDKDAIDGEINIDNLILYVKEFTKYVDLNEYDLKYMAYLYMRKLATSSYGYKQYLNIGNLDLLRFGKWRTNMCKYLFNHNEEITERLLKEFNTKHK